MGKYHLRGNHREKVTLCIATELKRRLWVAGSCIEWDFGGGGGGEEGIKTKPGQIPVFQEKH